MHNYDSKREVEGERKSQVLIFVSSCHKHENVHSKISFMVLKRGGVRKECVWIVRSQMLFCSFIKIRYIKNIKITLLDDKIRNDKQIQYIPF